MGKAMTAGSDICSVERKSDEKANISLNSQRSESVGVLVTKNLLFWGSITLSLYLLYAVVAAI